MSVPTQQPSPAPPRSRGQSPALRSSMAFRSWGSVAFMVIAALFAGGFFLFMGLMLVGETAASMDYRSRPTTTGKVISARAVPWKTAGNRIDQTILVEFEYVVAGEALTSTNLGVHQWFSTDQREVDKALSRYPVGKEVTVYYDPGDPSDGVIAPELTRQHMRVAFLSTCPLVALAGIFLLNTPLKRKWNDPRVPATAVFAGGVWRIRPVLNVFRAALGGGSLASLIVVFRFDPAQPATLLDPVSGAAVVGGAALGFSLVAVVLGLGLWLGRPSRHELVIDMNARQVILPRPQRREVAAGPGGEAHPIAFERVLAVDPVKYPQTQLTFGQSEQATTFAPLMTIAGTGEGGTDKEVRLTGLTRKLREQTTLCAFVMSLIDPRFAEHQAQTSSDFTIMTYEESLRAR